jgi:2-polyprenyl-3-methyl-5-hydroxy-6-metoxy-1,4-benzoquinol methylase
MPNVFKRLAGPFRKFFNARFEAIHRSVLDLRSEERDRYEATTGRLNEVLSRLETVEHVTRMSNDHSRDILEASHLHRDEALHGAALLGRSVDELTSRLDAFIEAQAATVEGAPTLSEIAQTIDSIARAVGPLSFDPVAQGPLPQLETYEATVANYSNSHSGWASQAGLWFNPPLSIAFAAGGVSLSDVNERIAEVPFVYRTLGTLAPGARILDVGATESSVALSLATLGYDVTAVDPRPYPLNHPRLTCFQGPIEDFSTDGLFDAVILLSSIEHFGLGAYDLPADESADIKAMALIHELVRPGGRLVLTTPFGVAPTTELERTYTPERLAVLLDGWDVEQLSYLTRVSPTEWTWLPAIDDLVGDHVVLVSAVRSGSAS